VHLLDRGDLLSWDTTAPTVNGHRYLLVTPKGFAIAHHYQIFGGR
jgi:hypothetical protein